MLFAGAGGWGPKELPSAALPIAAVWGSVCPSVRPRPFDAALGHDPPLCGGCRGLVPVGDAPVHPEPTVRSLQLWWHRRRLLMATLAVSGLSGCCALRVYEEGFANLCVRRRVPAACSLPAPRCLPLHAYAWSRAAPPCRGPADPTGLPRETSLQQGAEKCP